MPRGGAEVAEV